MTVEYLSLAELLKLYRERRGLSQRQLALQANLDPSLISKWENALRIPSRANLKDMAEVLQLSHYQMQNLVNAIEGVVGETLALHELLSLYLSQSELTDAQILERLGESDRGKLRAWRSRSAIPSNRELNRIIQTFSLDEERASKLRSARPRLDFNPDVFAFILTGSGQVADGQIQELINRGLEIVIRAD